MAAGSAAAPAGAGTHLVLIPSFDTGPALARTLRDAVAQWPVVWVVIDGSTDGSTAIAQRIAADDARLRVFVLPHNQGKGAAVLHGLRAALAEGFTYALTMDADGQHPAALIPRFIDQSVREPQAMILGRPVFDASAPLLRVRGRRISNGWTNLETLGAGIADSLYGFRVYPIAPLVSVMQSQRWMRRFDFDTEAVVRLAWRGVRPINLDAPVKYLKPEEGGVSHFRYVRDNALLTWMHMRLMAGFVLRLPLLVGQRLRRRPPFDR
jgi:glycosyltransferase involved in cell wall biosynthesis